jgi:hypothetical protein
MNKWPKFVTSKWKVCAGFSAVTRSFEDTTSFLTCEERGRIILKSTKLIASYKQFKQFIELTFQFKKNYVFIEAVGWIGSTSGRGNEETKIDFKKILILLD